MYLNMKFGKSVSVIGNNRPVSVVLFTDTENSVNYRLPIPKVQFSFGMTQTKTELCRSEP